MSKYPHDFDTHRCSGTRANQCSIRRYPAPTDGRGDSLYYKRDGRWHLFAQQYDFDWGDTYMSHVAPISVCPFCGALLDKPNARGKNKIRTKEA